MIHKLLCLLGIHAWDRWHDCGGVMVRWCLLCPKTQSRDKYR